MPHRDLDKLSARELDELILRAARRRARLEASHGDEPPARLDVIGDPRWFVNPQDDGALLRLRHPGHGWLAFLLPPHERVNLLTALLAQALQPPAPATENSPEGKPKASSSGGSRVH